MRRLQGEHGISSVVVLVSLIGIFGAAMLSLDAGNMWQTRRNIIIGTDSTALDQAKSLAFAADKTGCQATWTDYLLRNSGGGTGVTPISCNTRPLANGTGSVTVEGRKDARTRFGGLFGIGDTSPYSLSAAQWGFITEATGIRPMGVCSQNDHVEEWVAFKNGAMTEAQYNALSGSPASAHPVYAGAGVVHRILFTKENPNDCGPDAPGNWGWMDFECNNDGDTPSSICGNSNAELVEMILNGYQNNVAIDDCDADADQPGGESGDYCNGEVGSSGGSITAALNQLIGKGTKFPIPIFDQVTIDSGNNVYFNMRYFVGVILRGYKVTGAQADRYFDFEFVDLVTTGNCCQPAPAVDTGIRGVRLCNVDHDVSGLTAAQRCGQ